MSQIDNFVYVDASSTPNPGQTEYRGLYKGQIIFSKHIGFSSINVGEFLAIIHALAYIKKHNLIVDGVYSDSVTAISWYKKRTWKSTYTKDLMKRAKIWLQTNKPTTKVIIFDTRLRGENPADYGRKSTKKRKPVDMEKCFKAFVKENRLEHKWNKFISKYQQLL